MTNQKGKSFSIEEPATLHGLSRKTLRELEKGGYIPRSERVVVCDGKSSYKKFGKDAFEMIMRIAGHLRTGHPLSAAAKKAAELDKEDDETKEEDPEPLRQSI